MRAYSLTYLRTVLTTWMWNLVSHSEGKVDWGCSRTGRKNLDLRRDEETGEFGIYHSEKLHTLHPSPNMTTNSGWGGLEWDHGIDGSTVLRSINSHCITLCKDRNPQRICIALINSNPTYEKVKEVKNGTDTKKTKRLKKNADNK